MKRKGGWIFYNSIHSYGQMIILPWAFSDSKPANFDALKEVAAKGATALTNVHGKIYKVIIQKIPIQIMIVLTLMKVTWV